MVASDKIIAKATDEYIIDIYDLKDNKFLRSLNTIYDSGGDRITISNDSKIIVVGSYYDGVEAFNIETGEKLWANKKIKQVQKICISLDDETIYILTENNKLIFLKFDTGEIFLNYNTITNFFYSFTGTLIIQKKNKILVSNNDVFNAIFEIEGYLLDVFSTNNNSLISEAYKNLKLVDNRTQKVIWSSDLPPGYAIHKIFKVSEFAIVALGKYSLPSEVENYLLKINFITGLVENKIKLNSESIFCFSTDGLKLYYSNGDIIDTL